MALTRKGALFAGALFAGALFGPQDITAAQLGSGGPDTNEIADLENYTRLLSGTYKRQEIKQQTAEVKPPEEDKANQETDYGHFGMSLRAALEAKTLPIETTKIKTTSHAEKQAPKKQISPEDDEIAMVFMMMMEM